MAARGVCMPIGLYFIHQQQCLEQRLIFWLPSVVTFSFVQLLHAPRPVGLPGAREAAAGQKSSKHVPALPASVWALQEGSRGAACEQFGSCWTVSSPSSTGPAGAPGFDSFGLSELTAMQSAQIRPVRNNEISCCPLQMIYVLWLVSM